MFYSPVHAGEQQDMLDGKIVTKLVKAQNSGRVFGEAKAIIHADSLAVWEVINNPENYTIINKRVDKSRKLSEKLVDKYVKTYFTYDDGTLESLLLAASFIGASEETARDYYYRHLNLPFPLKDKWLVMEEIVDNSKAEKGVFKLRYQRIMGSVDYYTSTWEVQSIGDGKTQVHLKYEMSMGFEIPQVLLTLGGKVDLPGSLKTVRKLVKK